MTSRGARARGSGLGLGARGSGARARAGADSLRELILLMKYILEPRASLNGTIGEALVWCNFSETDRNTISGFGVNTKKTMKFGVITKKAVKFGVITKKQ